MSGAFASLGRDKNAIKRLGYADHRGNYGYTGPFKNNICHKIPDKQRSLDCAESKINFPGPKSSDEESRKSYNLMAIEDACSDEDLCYGFDKDGLPKQPNLICVKHNMCPIPGASFSDIYKDTIKFYTELTDVLKGWTDPRIEGDEPESLSQKRDRITTQLKEEMEECIREYHELPYPSAAEGSDSISPETDQQSRKKKIDTTDSMTCTDPAFFHNFKKVLTKADLEAQEGGSAPVEEPGAAASGAAAAEGEEPGAAASEGEEPGAAGEAPPAAGEAPPTPAAGEPAAPAAGEAPPTPTPAAGEPGEEPAAPAPAGKKPMTDEDLNKLRLSAPEELQKMKHWYTLWDPKASQSKKCSKIFSEIADSELSPKPPPTGPGKQGDFKVIKSFYKRYLKFGPTKTRRTKKNDSEKIDEALTNIEEKLNFKPNNNVDYNAAGEDNSPLGQIDKLKTYGCEFAEFGLPIGPGLIPSGLLGKPTIEDLDTFMCLCENFIPTGIFRLDWNVYRQCFHNVAFIMKLAEEYNPDSYEVILEAFKEPLLDKFFANFGYEFTEHRDIMQKFDKNFTKLCKIESTYLILGPQKWVDEKIERLTDIAETLGNKHAPDEVTTVLGFTEKKKVSGEKQKIINKQREGGTAWKS
jgi:hypothetical protein